MFESLTSRLKKPGFWSWFKVHGERLRAGMDADPQPTLVEIGAAFKEAYPTLVWEVERTRAGGWSFSVSADGKRERFPAVLEAVRDAPEIPGWTVNAFRQPGSPGTIRFGDVRLDSSDLSCLTRPKGEGVEVILWIRGLNRELEEQMIGAAFVLFDNAVGEWDAVMTIVAVHPAPLPDDPELRARGIPLAELPRALEAHPGRRAPLH